MVKENLVMNELFPCYKCGLCCQNVDKSEETKFLDRGDGTCRHYDEETKLCTIYETRPDICRVDKQYELNYKEQYSWQEFTELNLIACKILQEKNSK